MPQEIGVGIVGTGFMGKTHTLGYASLPLFYSQLPFKANLVGICSGSIEHARAAKEAYGFGFAADSIAGLLDRKDIQVIHICTPNALHYPQVKAALLAGKHVYCDKPLAMTPQEADKLAALAAKTGLTAQVAFQNRFFPATMRAKELIDEERLGRILSFRACYLHSSLPDPQKPLNWKQDAARAGGGVLVDMGSHVIDLMHHLLGNYDQILCETQLAYPQRPDNGGVMHDIAAEDAAVMIVRMKNGALGSLEASKIATGANDDLRFEIHGSGGALRFSLMEPCWLEFYDNTVPDGPYGGNKGTLRIDCIQKYPFPGDALPSPKNSIGWLRAHVHCLYTFLMHVVNGEPGCPSFDDGAYVQRVMAQAYRSRDERCWTQI